MAIETLYLGEWSTPAGDCYVVFDAAGALRALEWQDFKARLHQLLARHCGAEGRGHRLEASPLPAPLSAALAAYVAGDAGALEPLPVMTSGTPFQQAVWAALRKIPVGQTTSYGALAASIGRPAAVRAIGLAVGANPISIVVPCHRVIGSDGSLTGYAGGIARKRWLLGHEGAAFR
ncbi:MAG: hypothetical protein RLZZ200_13 [Pseudomonadota bacterium]|jgi:methylated-DNA-[protein]-cysteine S-methyltransferase